MDDSIVKDILPASVDLPRSHRRLSNLFPGHDGRMEVHAHRVRFHTCERTDGQKCADCIKGKLR